METLKLDDQLLRELNGFVVDEWKAPEVQEKYPIDAELNARVLQNEAARAYRGVAEANRKRVWKKRKT